MTKDESRAVSFVATLLVLALIARFMNRPKPVTITAGQIDLAALQAAGQSLQQPTGRRGKKTTHTSQKADAGAAQVVRGGGKWTEPAWRRGGAPPVFIEAQSGTAPDKKGPLDLNHATATEIERLPGIGATTAKRIVARRDSLGRFERIEDLDPIKGIGLALMKKLSPLVRFR